MDNTSNDINKHILKYLKSDELKQNISKNINKLSKEILYKRLSSLEKLPEELQQRILSSVTLDQLCSTVVSKSIYKSKRKVIIDKLYFYMTVENPGVLGYIGNRAFEKEMKRELTQSQRKKISNMRPRYRYHVRFRQAVDEGIISHDNIKNVLNKLTNSQLCSLGQSIW